MLFSSFVFIWIFLPIVLIASFVLLKFVGISVTNCVLLVASLFFYAWGEPIYMLLMLFSIAFNWLSGVLLSKLSCRKLVITGAVCGNLLLLGYYKYAGMTVESVNSVFGLGLSVPKIALPIGISFFTFQALSYVIDVYRRKCNTQYNILKLALYISFFPQLIAGPIVKYTDIEAQIDFRSISKEKFSDGIKRFAYGFGKKVLIANAMAACVDRIYALELSNVTGIMAWTASILYTFQIYYDFSGYSDMAIGLGRMFGFDFVENFNYPYISLSIREFWRRWHISLGSWFREYVYIPLGGNRGGKRLTCENTLIVFFLTGLWHGASWNFVLWGIIHGVLIVIERLGFGKILGRHKVLSWFYTFIVVNMAWVFFRIESIKTACAYFKRMVLPWLYMNSTYSTAEILDLYTLFIAVCAFIGMGILQLIPRIYCFQTRFKNSVFEDFFCIVILFISMCALAGNTYNPFIYFRF